jgi:hypothetical protein
MKVGQRSEQDEAMGLLTRLRTQKDEMLIQMEAHTYYQLLSLCAPFVLQFLILSVGAFVEAVSTHQ